MDNNKINSTNKHFKKEVQWLDEVDDYRKVYKINLQTLSCLWNDITPIQLQHLNEFIKQTEMMDSTDTCLSYKNESISAKGFLSLSDQTWITDDVVNFYCKLLTDRDTKLVQSQLHKKPNIFLSSFFYSLLERNMKVKHFVEKKEKNLNINIFQADKVYIPININNIHWLMVVIMMKAQVIEAYDSKHKLFINERHEALQKILNFVGSTYEDTYNSTLPTSWRLNHGKRTIPRQNNDNDCGAFMLSFLDMNSVGDDLNFTQGNISNFRKRIQLSIITNNCLM